MEYDDLDPEIQEEIDRLNLEEILSDHIESSEEIDIPLVRFIVGRLAQINNPNSMEVLINNIEKLYPVFKDVMKYYQNIEVDKHTKKNVGNQLLSLINESSLVGIWNTTECGY